MKMFYAYLKLIARHITWLERKFPKFMFAHRHSFSFLVAQLLITPGMIILIILPFLLMMLVIFSLPIPASMQGVTLLIVGIAFFVILLRVLIKESKRLPRK